MFNSQTSPLSPYEPKQLLEIVDKEILDHLLLGFEESLDMAVTIVYLKEGKPDYIKPGDPNRHRADSCRLFRQSCDNICVKSDTTKANQLIKKNKQKAEIYTCSSLGLQDMAYPIHIFGKTLGVILAGQKWLVGETYANNVLSNANRHCPTFIKDKVAYDNFYNTLINSERLAISHEDLENCFKEFCNFGKLVTGIIKTIADKEEKIHQNEFIEWMEDFLSVVPDTKTNWQHILTSPINELISHCQNEIKHAMFFIGEKKDDKIQYSLFSMSGDNWIESKEINLEKNLEFKDKYSGNSLPTEIKKGLASYYSDKDYYYLHTFKRETTFDFGDIYSLIVLTFNSDFDTQSKDFYNDCCKSICRADSFSRLFIQQKITHASFERRVIDLRHDLKTSIQHVQGNLEILAKFISNKLPNSIKIENSKWYKQTIESFDDHAKSIKHLVPPIESIKPGKLQRIDLFEKIYERLLLYAAYAYQKEIQIVIPDGKYPKEVDIAYVYCIEREINRAIDALIDNAIKYSFIGKKIHVTGKIGYSSATFSISNYGIGVQPKNLEILTQRYFRAEIKDEKVNTHNIWFRKGTGLGLSIASYVFSNLLKGEMKFQSKNNHVSDNTQRYLEFLTTATVILPIQKGIKNEII